MGYSVVPVGSFRTVFIPGAVATVRMGSIEIVLFRQARMNDGTPKLPFLFLVEGENTGPPANHVSNLSSIEYDMIFGFCSCYLYNMKGVLVSC